MPFPACRGLDRGFTLVELLVVLAIIAVLSALLFSGAQSIRLKAAATRSASNIRALGQANLAYLAENGRYVPADDQSNLRRWHGARPSAGEPFDPAGGFLAAYLGPSRQVTACPVFRGMLAGNASFEEGSGGYGYNATYIGGTPEWQWNADGSRVAELPARVEKPATTVMFASTAYARAEGVQEYPFAEPPFWDFGTGPAGFRPSPTVHFRFEGKALVAWCDGHVSYETRVERPEGTNPHGGQAGAQDLGWFGPDAENGFWNPRRESP